MEADSTQRKLQTRYVTIATRPEHDIRGKLLALASNLSDRGGMRVEAMDALHIAVNEALRKRGVTR